MSNELDKFKKETLEKWEWIKSINFGYGDEKFIQKVKNDKFLLDDITNIQKENSRLKENNFKLQKEIKEKDIEIEAYKNAIQNISVNFNGAIKNTSKKVSKSKGE